jgi:hypothetical protein
MLDVADLEAHTLYAVCTCLGGGIRRLMNYTYKRIKDICFFLSTPNTQQQTHRSQTG